MRDCFNESTVDMAYRSNERHLPERASSECAALQGVTFTILSYLPPVFVRFRCHVPKPSLQSTRYTSLLAN